MDIRCFFYVLSLLEINIIRQKNETLKEFTESLF